MTAASAADRRRDTKLAALIGVALFAAYAAVSRGQLKSYDGSMMVQLATRLLEKHTLTTDPLHDALHVQSPHVSYGFGTTLLALPFDAVQRWIHARGQSILTLANPLVLAAGGITLFYIGRRLDWHRWVCVATALGFGLLTTAVWQSTEMFSEPGVTLGCLFVVLAVLEWNDNAMRAGTLMGVGIAGACLFRPDAILLVGPLALALFFVVPRRAIFERRALTRLAIPVALFLVFQLWYDFYRYDSIFKSGFSQQARGRGFNTPLFQGLDLLLRSPGRGFFWTSAILLLALPGFVTLYRRMHPLTIAIAIAVAVRFLYFARWWTPGGGVAWGPRLLFPATALLAIPAGDFVQRVTAWRYAAARRVTWMLIAGLALVSAFVAFLSISIGFEQYWNKWTHVSAVLLPSHVHSYFWSIAHSPLAGNLHLLRIGNPRAPIHFRDGADVVGIAAIVISLAAIVAAIKLARDAPPSTPEPIDVTAPNGALADPVLHAG